MTAVLLRFTRAFCSVLRVTTGLLLVASVLINSANIIGRYFLGESLPWAEEIMLFLMTGCVFLANGLVGYADRQIRMDVIVAMLPTRLRVALKLLSDLVFIATAILLAVYAAPIIFMLWSFNERSAAANFPMVIPQAMIPIGLLLTAFLVAVRLVTRASGEPPGPKH